MSRGYFNTHKKLIYENFHRNTSVQRKIISKNNFTYRIILNVINKIIKTRKEVLDIGCGAGTISFYLASKGNKVYGIDISKNAIEKCRESAKTLGLEKATFFQVMNFPYRVPNKKFDFILCLEVLEHLRNDRHALRQIYHLLKKNRLCIISVPSKNAPLFRLGLLNKFDSQVGHLRRYTLEDILDICTKEKFKVVYWKKEEGILRNFLFTTAIGGLLLKFVKYFISDIVTFVDKFFLKLFGESNIIVVVRK